MASRSMEDPDANKYDMGRRQVVESGEGTGVNFFGLFPCGFFAVLFSGPVSGADWDR